MLKKYIHNIVSFFKEYVCFYKNNMVLVYSMRKVASTTLTNTLRKQGCTVIKQHCLNSINNHKFCKSLKYANQKKQHWLVDGNRFYRRLQLWKYFPRNYRLKVVSLVRDPLALNVSDMFTQMYYEFPEEFKRLELQDVDNLNTLLFDVMNRKTIPSLLSEYFHSLVDFPKHWFGSELKEVLGIDVFDTPFAKDKGYQIYQGDYIDVLLIRSEDVNSVALDALNEFLGLDLDVLDDRNVTNYMSGSELYGRMKSTLKFSLEFLNDYYSQSYANHFYSEAEIEMFKSHWL